MRDQDGNIVSDTEEVMAIWREHFRLHLNKEFPHEERVLELLQPGDGEAEEDDNISLEEIKSVVALLRTTNATGYDKITTRDAKKHVFFKPCFLCKKKSVFYRKKQFFNVFFLFFSITGRFLINYSAIRVYL